MLLNCGAGENSWESLGLQGDPASPSERRSVSVFIGRTNAEAETPILWPPDTKNWLIGKDPDAGKDWEQEEKWTTGEEVVGWHHQLNGHGFGWTPGFGDGQGGLACCGSWGHKESDTTEQLNWTEYVEFKKRIQMILFKKQRQTQRLKEWTYSYWGMGTDGEFQINMYTLLYLKQRTNKNLKNLHCQKKKKQYGNLNSLSRKQKNLPKDFSYITARLSTSE